MLHVRRIISLLNRRCGLFTFADPAYRNRLSTFIHDIWTCLFGLLHILSTFKASGVHSFTCLYWVPGQNFRWTNVFRTKFLALSQIFSTLSAKFLSDKALYIGNDELNFNTSSEYFQVVFRWKYFFLILADYIGFFYRLWCAFVPPKADKIVKQHWAWL